MKKHLFFKTNLLLLFLVLSGSLGYSQCSELIFSDEFDGSSVDQNKWSFDVGDGCPELCGYGNAEEQYYTTENTTVQNGNLVITAKNESKGGKQYTSSKLITSGKFNSKYGRYEASIKLPSAGGIWPAFWMLPEVSNWPFTGEIDIMEAQHNNPEAVGGTVHYNNGGHQFNGREYTAGLDLSEGFHEYAVEWEPNEIRWYVDDQLYHTVTPSTTVDPWPFADGDWYLILNVAVGGPGTPYTGFISPSPADYPTQMEVDYVRVYSGTFNTQLIGDNQVYEGDTNKVYSITSIPGASYNWSIPAGASIVSGQGTNAITVNWGTTGGDISVSANVSGCGVNDYTISVVVDPPRTVEFVYEDFQSNRNISYGETTSGDLTQAIANPGSSSVNNSSLVGRYQRNGGSQFDVLFMESADIGNSLEFISGKRTIWMEVYSDAPVGTEFILQIENSNLSSGAYPSGRHSRYAARTTTQNQWETVEFELFDRPDTSVGAFEANQFALLIDPDSNSDYTIYFDNIRSMVAPDAPILGETIIANYDGVNFLNPIFENGSYTANVANPNTNTINSSANVARYVRDEDSQFDVVSFSTTVIENSGPFKDGDHIFYMDVYTAAAIGTEITLSLENSAISEGDFPFGRNSQYAGIVSAQNAWHTIAFTHATSPDAGTSDLAVNEISILFDPNSTSSDTYYFDNFRYGITVLPPLYNFSEMIHDYNGANNLAYNSLSTGAYTTDVSNPSSNTVNSSSRAGRYVRNNAELYDVLFFDTDFIEDASSYVSEDKRFAMDVYTSAPVGTIITWQLEASSVATPTNFPSGRHSVYQAVVQEQNSWHSLEFILTGTPDLILSDEQIDTVVFLFDPNNTSNDTFYIDNLRSLSKEEGIDVPVLSSVVISPDNGVINQGQTLQLTAQGFDQNGELFDTNFDWTATGGLIDDNGLYTGSAIGMYTIAATNGSISASVSVTVEGNTISFMTIPGILEAEDYKEGGEGIGYHDTNLGNRGGAYRDDDVDIQTTTGGFNVGWIITGEWLAYDVNASTSTSNYDINFRVASPRSNATFHLELDGISITEVISVPNTNGWQNYQTITITDVEITNGSHELRLVIDQGGFNIDNFEFVGASGSTIEELGCSDTADNGQYSYIVSDDTTNPTITFTPEVTGMGEDVCILFYGTSPTGGYPGYNVSPNEPFQINANAGDQIYFYYTYSLPTGGENNTASSRHDVIVGNCLDKANTLDKNNKVGIDVFPNPMDTQLIVSGLDNTYLINVYNITGKLVKTEVVNVGETQMTMDVSSLSKGFYIVKTFSQQKQPSIHKILKN